MTDAGAKEAREPKLPIRRIVADSYRILFRNFGTYVRLSWFPFLIVILSAVALQFYDRAFNGNGDSSLSWTSFGSILIGEVVWLVTIPLATAWSRLTILGRDRPGFRISYSIGREERVYLWRYICLALLVYLPAVVPVWLFLTLAADWIDGDTSGHRFVLVLFALFLIIAVVFWVLCRLSLAFPAAAIGARFGFRDSWRTTTGHVLRMIFAFFLAYVPVFLGVMVIEWIVPNYEFSAEDGIGKALLIGVGDNLFLWLFYTLSVTSLALIYKQLVGPSHSEPSGTQTP